MLKLLNILGVSLQSANDKCCICHQSRIDCKNHGGLELLTHMRNCDSCYDYVVVKELERMYES